VNVKKLYLLLGILAIASLLLTGCAEHQPDIEEELTVGQLLADPAKYNDRPVTVQGFYFHGFETIVLSENLEYSGYAEGHLVPSGETVWVEGGIPQAVYDELYVQSMMGPSERYGKVKMKGKFAAGGQYGHVGAYSYQISPVEVELLPWSPPDSD
jgi:hypothetical protein